MEKKYQIILMILLFIFLTFVSFLFSPFFHIREFVFHSRNEIEKNELRGTINSYYGENLLFLNEEELKTDLLKHQLISSIEIEKSFPSTVHVVVEERNAVAWLNNNQQKLIFSADGIILGEEELTEKTRLPEFEGFAYYFDKNKVMLPLLTNEILKVLNNLEADFLEKISKVLYRDGIFILYLRDGGGVNLGRNSQLEEKFAILKSILANNQQAEIDYINLQVTKHPVIKLK